MTERSRKALTDKMKSKARLSGRERKDQAMKVMRELAGRGGFTGWSHVLALYEQQNPDDASLRIWAGASDKNEIDMICLRWSKAQPKRRR